MRFNLFFNKAAAPLFNGKPSVRVKIDPKTQTLSLRPTDRKRGNDLVSLHQTMRGGIRLAVEHVEMDFLNPSSGSKLRIQTDRWGWLRVLPSSGHVSKNDAHGRIGRSPLRPRSLKFARFGQAG